MVGAARIELATPAMSTQCLREKREFSAPAAEPGAGTGTEQTGNRREFHRNYTGAASAPPLNGKAPDVAGTTTRAELSIAAEKRAEVTTQAAIGKPSRLRTDPLSIFLPGLHDPIERELRERLMTARDIASAKIARLDPGHALGLHLMIVEVTTAWVFAPATIEQLQDVSDHCRRMLLCASTAERLSGGHA